MARLFPKIHELNIESLYFEQIIGFKKNFEIRKNDRDYQYNDCLLLREYLPTTKLYTGKSCLVFVASVHCGGTHGVQSDYCVLSIRLLSVTN